MSALKQDIRRFRNDASCGETLYLSGESKMHYEAKAVVRYAFEPYILNFAQFPRWKGKQILAIGIGLGADHQKFVEAGAYGIDLTKRVVARECDSRCSIEYGKARLAAPIDKEILFSKWIIYADIRSQAN